MSNPFRKSVMVSVDGSEQALDAVRYVANTVPPKAVGVVLFHVMTKVPESFLDLQRQPTFNYRIADIKEWEIQQEKAIQDFMGQACEVLFAAGIPKESVKVRIEERKVGIARDIIAESQSGYDTVVVGRRGVSELKDFVLGSIANKLVEKLVHVPIWIVGSGRQRGKFIVALDASEGAMLAVDYVAKALGGLPAIDVTLYHVVRGYDIFHPVVEKPSPPTPDRMWRESLEKELEEAGRGIEPVFEEATKRLLKAGLAPARINEKVVKGAGSPAGAILEEVERGGYDTIVVGRRGLSKVQEFFIGRVSNKIIQLAKDKTVWVIS
jgi:nucleotide-binding universal stress UspA family protein